MHATIIFTVLCVSLLRDKTPVCRCHLITAGFVSLRSLSVLFFLFLDSSLPVSLCLSPLHHWKPFFHSARRNNTLARKLNWNFNLFFFVLAESVFFNSHEKGFWENSVGQISTMFCVLCVKRLFYTMFRIQTVQPVWALAAVGCVLAWKTKKECDGSPRPNCPCRLWCNLSETKKKKWIKYLVVQQ